MLAKAGRRLIQKNGFSLIELMIAIVIGFIVVGATITIYVMSIRASSDTMKSAQLNQDLSLAVSIMTNDIRRAGYWAGAVIGADSRNNPFVVVDSTNLEVNGNCITYTYDADRDGVVQNTAGVSDEQFGFRLNNETIEMKDRGSTTNGCVDNNAVWVDMLDSDRIRITGLTFDMVLPVSSSSALTLPNLILSQCVNGTTVTSGLCNTTSVPSGDTGLQVRRVLITVDGEVVGDSSIKSSYSSLVTVRNTRIYTQP